MTKYDLPSPPPLPKSLLTWSEITMLGTPIFYVDEDGNHWSYYEYKGEKYYPTMIKSSKAIKE